MEKVRWVLAGVAGLGLFMAGYLAGKNAVLESAGLTEKSTHMPRRPNRQDFRESLPERTRVGSAQKPAEGKHAGYRRIVEMVSKGELRIEGVDINSENFSPGDKVAEFFGLSEDQLAEMKRLGLERLQEKHHREQSLAKFREVSESGMVVDLPADPEFAAAEAALFIADIHQGFGPDVAEMLQKSIEGAYGDFTSARHVRYSLTRRVDLANLPADAPQEIRAMHEGMYDYKLSINCNADGSFMANEQGQMLRGGSSSAGTMSLNDTKPDAHRPRYHYLWEQAMGGN